MKLARLLSVLLCAQILLNGAIHSPCQAQGSSELARRVEALAEPYITSETLVGVSIGVIKNGEQATVHMGKVSENGEKPDDSTIYEIGSISKVFTGLMLADAVSRDLVQLDQPAQQLLPDGVTMPKEKDRDVTLVDISTHRSGLPRLPNNMRGVNGDNPYSRYNSQLAHEFLKGHQLRSAPGEKYEYSNFAVSLLGHLIAEKSGTTYEKLLRERLTKPLGMQDTVIELSDAQQKRLATAHSSPGVPTSTWEFADLPGAGGIRSTTHDMMLFAAANLNPPEGEVGEAINLALQKHHPGSAGEPAMGLGWHFAGDGLTRWHNGQTGGYHSMLMINRDAKLAVVVLTNTAEKDVDRLAHDVMQLLAGNDVKPRDFPKTVKVANDVMQRYVGRYQLAPGFVFTVSTKNNNLLVGLTGQPTLQVYPESDTVWFYKVVKAQLTFNVNDNGKCESVELFQNGIRQTAKRIEQ